MESELSSIDGDVESCKEQVLKLEGKLLEMVNKKKELLVRGERAEEKNYANSVYCTKGGTAWVYSIE